MTVTLRLYPSVQPRRLRNSVHVQLGPTTVELLYSSIDHHGRGRGRSSLAADPPPASHIKSEDLNGHTSPVFLPGWDSPLGTGCQEDKNPLFHNSDEKKGCFPPSGSTMIIPRRAGGSLGLVSATIAAVFVWYILRPTFLERSTSSLAPSPIPPLPAVPSPNATDALSQKEREYFDPLNFVNGPGTKSLRGKLRRRTVYTPWSPLPLTSFSAVMLHKFKIPFIRAI